MKSPLPELAAARFSYSLLSLKRVWSKGLKIGYDPSQSGLEKSRVMMLNGIAFVTTFSVLIYSIVYYLTGYRYYYGPLYIVPIAAAVLFLNHTKRYLHARFLYFLGSFLIITYWCYEGRGNGNEYTLVGLATTSTLIFSQRSTVYLNNLLCATLFLVYKQYDAVLPFEPDPTINYDVVPWIILVNTVGVISFQMAFFRDLVHHYDKKMLIKYREQSILLERQKVVEEELKTSNDKLHDVMEKLEMMVSQKTKELQTYIEAINVNIFSSVSDLNGYFLHVNEQVIKTSEYTQEELIGNHYNLLASGRHANSFFTERRKELLEGRTWRGEVEHRTKSGNLLWFDCVVIPIRDNSQTIQSFLTLGLPITERKRHEKISEETHKVLETITFRTSHNIRGPLARVKGLAELVKRDLIQVDEFKLIAEKMAICSDELNTSTSDLVKFVLDHQEFINDNSSKS